MNVRFWEQSGQRQLTDIHQHQMPELKVLKTIIGSPSAAILHLEKAKGVDANQQPRHRD
jgi:hypothetical protein